MMMGTLTSVIVEYKYFIVTFLRSSQKNDFYLNNMSQNPSNTGRGNKFSALLLDPETSTEDRVRPRPAKTTAPTENSGGLSLSARLRQQKELSQPGRSDRSDGARFERSERAERTERTERTERPRFERTERTERSERPRFERTERTERTEKMTSLSQSLRAQTKTSDSTVVRTEEPLPLSDESSFPTLSTKDMTQTPGTFVGAWSNGAAPVVAAKDLPNPVKKLTKPPPVKLEQVPDEAEWDF